MNYYGWLVGSLALAGIGLLVRKRQLVAGTVLAAVGALAAMGVIVWQVYGLAFGSTNAPPVDRQQAVVAYFMGYEVLAELNSRKGTVALVLPPDTRANQAELDSLFNTFARVVAPVTGLKLVDVSVAAEPRAIREGNVSAAAFNAAVADLTNLVACVSFVGVPREVERLALRQAEPPVPLFVYDPSGGTHWVVDLKAGHIRRVIVPRPLAPGEMIPVGGAPDELFRRGFRLATPATAEAIAAELSMAPPG